MKAVSIILAVVLVYTNAVEDQDVLQQWQKFQADFGKSYRSPLEARKRFNIFQDNLKVIEAHNSLFEKGQYSFTMGINKFSDWTDSEFDSFVNGGLVNASTPLKGNNYFERSPNFVAPNTFDWRDHGIVTPVKDQGSCEGCWAFSATGGLEGAYAIKTGKLISLSEQNLIDCSHNGGNGGCKTGGLMTLAFDYIEKYGIDKEDDYPFEARDRQCRASQHDIVTKVSGYVNIRQGDEAGLVEAIKTKGPVCIGVDASNSFKRYKSGIFDGSCSNTHLNHGILAVGFGSENGKDFYIVKNSWGPSWGENGYIRLARNSGNKCGVSSMATYPII
ncbi:hypothetical protein WA026_015030 [Henosepilachna vigintioctopunctata]|uniref:Cathepsin L n=1 Tax=Henosepilachna vigintioctopunctata TaxID=420089 RepID=A0AAW1TZ04_9CUCU